MGPVAADPVGARCRSDAVRWPASARGGERRGGRGTGVYTHEPITDAEEPCPLCGEAEYEHEDEATRTARLARLRAEQAVQRWYSDKMTLMGVTFPIYAAEGWPARISGGGSHGDDLTHLRIAHTETRPDSTSTARPLIEVTTSLDPHQPGELSIAREAFANRMTADADPKLADDLSNPAVTLSLRAARRRRVAASRAASVGQTPVTIDGAPEPFVVVGELSALWVAVRRHHDLTITIAAQGIDPASLVIEPIADPSARLLGPKPNEP